MARDVSPMPRILNAKAARAYLGGLNPANVMPPVKLGGRLCWDRVALDQELDKLFGVAQPIASGGEETALERWRKGRAGVSERPT